MNPRDIQLAIFMCVASQDPEPVSTADLFPAFDGQIEVREFSAAVCGLVTDGDLVSFRLDGCGYLQLSEKSRKKVEEIADPISGLSVESLHVAHGERAGSLPGSARRDSDPLQELLLYSSFFNPHTPEKCDCGELVVRHCRCGKGVCQRHGYAIQDSLDVAKQTILCGECKGTADCELWGELSYGRAEAR